MSLISGRGDDAVDARFEEAIYTILVPTFLERYQSLKKTYWSKTQEHPQY